MRCADSYVVAVVVLRRCGIEYVGVCENDEDKFARESATTEATSGLLMPMVTGFTPFRCGKTGHTVPPTVFLNSAEISAHCKCLIFSFPYMKHTLGRFQILGNCIHYEPSFDV